MKPYLKITLTLFITITIILGFALPVNMPAGNWYLQPFPNLGNNRIINDIIFVDSLNGYAVTRITSSNDTNYILKSTNSGDNWNIVYRQFTASIAPFNKVKFLNKDTGFVGGNRLLKTINGGINWTALNLPAGAYSQDISVLNEDTLWFADMIPFDGGLFRSTDKGVSWVLQYDATPAPNPDHVYMYNGRIGFMTRNNLIYKTTNSGFNWFTIPGGLWSDIHFVDSLTGWKANIDIKKTTDGGQNWTTQILPTGGVILTTSISKFSFLSRDTIWGAGGQAFYGAGRFRGIIYRTTNGGNNWLFQVPDTSFGIEGFNKVQFLNKNIGWGYGIRPTSISLDIHTTNGGDTTFLVGLQQISSQIPKDFILYQNYPNPFNPKTNIKYQIIKSSFVQLSIYDITGKFITNLVNQKQSAGIYLADWNASGYASGVYFYALLVNGLLFGVIKMILIK